MPHHLDTVHLVLAYVHPAIVGLGVALVFWAFTNGLQLRDARVKKRRAPAGTRRKHMQLARPAVIILLLGFTLGPIIAVWVRGWQALGTFHGWAGLVAATLFSTTALLGLRLQDKRSQRQNLHGILGVLAVLVAAVAVITGIALLP